MDSGFAGGTDEIYNVYDQPFRSGRDMAQNIYRPGKNADKDVYGDDLDTLMQSNRYGDSCILTTEKRIRHIKLKYKGYHYNLINLL